MTTAEILTELDEREDEVELCCRQADDAFVMLDEMESREAADQTG